MFTGIVEELGKIQKVVRRGGGKRFTIEAEEVVKDLQVGESLSVNGTCLTILSVKSGDNSRQHEPRNMKHEIEVEAGEETLKRTTLTHLRPGERVNLERALRVGDRLGGHFVLGHVDGIGKIRRKKVLASSTLLEIDSPQDFSSYLVEKGSISVDGVSLTIVSTRKNRFSISILPYTQKVTTLGSRKIGDEVNIETDMIAKHIHKISR